MKPTLLGQAYDQIADVWRDDRFDADNGMAMHRRALQFLEVEGACLNVGCGCNTRFNRLLREQGLDLEGLDVSARMIELAREADPDATYVEADICQWQPSRAYALITAWDSIWHVPLTSQADVLSKLMAALVPGGVLMFSTGGLAEATEHRDSVMGPEVYYSTLGIAGILSLVDAYGCVCRHLEFDHWPELHLTVIVQKPA